MNLNNFLKLRQGGVVISPFTKSLIIMINIAIQRHTLKNVNLMKYWNLKYIKGLEKRK